MGNLVSLLFLVGDLLKVAHRLTVWFGGPEDGQPMTPDAL